MSAREVTDGLHRPIQKTKKKTPGHGWAIEDHICRSCFGRILSQPGEDGDSSYRCSHCGAVAYGRSAAVLCCCGIVGKSRARGKSAAPVNLGIRCVPNPDPTPEFPGEIVATELPK